MTTEEKWVREWTVEPDGSMVHNGRPFYEITGARLEENWLEHMSEKTWVDMNTFVPAYITACYRAGVKSVEIGY